VAPVAVLLPGIPKGVLFAAIASSLMLLAVAARPHVAFLGRIPPARGDEGRAGEGPAGARPSRHRPPARRRGDAPGGL
jgi:hypothetical protein